MADYELPVPDPITPLTKPFWDAAKEHRLVMQRCKACNELFFFPREHCPNCFESDLDWQELSGNGRVYSYTIVRQSADPRFNEKVPYVYAIIQLDEGTRMISNIEDVDFDEVEIDMPVTVRWEDVTEEFSLPKFVPRR
jgi:uncharacterized OB-fold protein